MSCKAITKKGNRCKNSINCPIHRSINGSMRSGDGLFSLKTIKDIPRRVRNVFRGPANTEPSALRSFLNGQGNQEIVGIELGRKPLQAKSFLNAITFGKLDKVMKKLKYDNLYHNYLIVKLKDGSSHVIEKNHIVERRPANASDYKNADVVEIPVNKQLTLKEAVENASKNDKDFWRYSALSGKNNCQNFTEDIILRNGLTPTEPVAVKALALQNTKDLGGQFSGIAKAGIQAVTDLAGAASRLITGDGLWKARDINGSQIAIPFFSAPVRVGSKLIEL